MGDSFSCPSIKSVVDTGVRNNNNDNNNSLFTCKFSPGENYKVIKSKKKIKHKQNTKQEHLYNNNDDSINTNQSSNNII
jgi:predicted transposase YbfD/YdcC